MRNLLSNAVRHTTDGSITIKLSRDDDKQIVSVIDTGEGMDTEIVNSVFKRYVSTKQNYWRHGVGLIACRYIVNAHGGEIWVNSEKGAGTTVFFSLPEGVDYE